MSGFPFRGGGGQEHKNLPEKTLGETLDFEEQVRTSEIELSPTRPDRTQQELEKLNLRSSLYYSKLRLNTVVAESNNHSKRTLTASYKPSESDDEDEENWSTKSKKCDVTIQGKPLSNVKQSASEKLTPNIPSVSLQRILPHNENRNPLNPFKNALPRNAVEYYGRGRGRERELTDSSPDESGTISSNNTMMSMRKEFGRGRGRGLFASQGNVMESSSAELGTSQMEHCSQEKKMQPTICRNTMLGKLLQLKGKSVAKSKMEQLDSDDSESYDSSIHEAISDSESVKQKPDSIKKLLDKPKTKVAYGCISIADNPSKGVLVRGPFLMTPLCNIKEFEYGELMKRGITNCGLEELNLLQKAVAPHFLRGEDCFIIGGRACGKSLAYLMPLAGSLIKEYEANSRDCDSKNKMFDSGPLCLIVCSDYKSAMKIEGHLQNLLGSTSRHQLSCALICDDHRDTRNKLELGVDVMITTITHAFDMLRHCNTHFKFDRLRYFIFDNMEVLLRRTPKEFEKVRTSVDEFVTKNPVRKPYQRIFCGLDWSDEIEELYLRLTGVPDPSERALPIVHIQSSNQAIKYSKLKWKMHHVTEEEKVPRLVGLLRSSVELLQHKKIFILCNSPDEAAYLHFKLEENQIHTCLAETNTMSTDDFKLIRRRWEDFPHNQRIMVLHDGILKGMEIYDVTCLIHYDLPNKTDTTKSAFAAERFTCMWGYFRDISEEKQTPALQYQRAELESHFLLTGEEHDLFRLKQFSNKLGFQMPDKLSSIADEMWKIKLQKHPVCPGIKLYGKCVDPIPNNCNCRHYFLRKELEKHPVVPRNAEIEVRITHCTNPSSYLGQILRCFEMKDNKKKLKNSYINVFRERTRKLSIYYEDEEKRVPPHPFESDTLCAVQLEDGFTRAKIETVMTRTTMNSPKTVRVFCIDSGEKRQVEAENLFKLPVEFEELTRLSVQIILANLKPTNGESDYRPFAVQMARRMTEDKILHAKVHFATDTTVWVNPLVELSVDPDTKDSVKKASIRIDLIKGRVAENNDWHIESIIDICKSVGFTCPEFEEREGNPALDSKFMEKFFRMGDDINWAYLQRSNAENPEAIEVWASYTKDPFNIFGNLVKFDNQLDGVITDLNSYIADLISETCQKYETQFRDIYEVGLVVAAFDRCEKKWQRAIITKQYGKGENRSFDVFYADIGDHQLNTTSKDLFPMPSDLVMRLPFQAVALELAHIKPVHSNDEVTKWSAEAEDKVIDFTLDENGDGRKLDVVALKSKKHPHLPCRYYSAVVFTDTGDDMGVMLVNEGLAKYAENGQETVKLVQTRLLAQLNQIYDNREDASEDEEAYDQGLGPGLDGDFNFDYDQWDIGGMAALNVDTLRQTVRKNGYVQPIQQESQEPMDEPQTPSIENQINGRSEPISSSSSSQQEASSSSSQQEGNAYVVSGFSDLLHPKVYWRQTNNQLILIINHPDIRKYTLNIDRQLVSFRTIEPPDYGFDIETFGRVESKAEEFLTGQYLRIKLNKRVKNWNWPRPTKSEIKYPWFKEDIENVHSSAEEEDEENKKSAKKLSSVSVNWERFDSGESDDISSDSDDDPEGTEAISV